jgi:hypothetical protein
MPHDVIGGYSEPVYVMNSVNADSDPIPVTINTDITQIQAGINGTAVGMVRQILLNQSVIANASTVSGSIDKRGFACVAYTVSANFNGTKIWYQVSHNDAQWYFLRNPVTGTPFEVTLAAGVANSFLAETSVIAFPFVRFVVLNASNVPQTQTNVIFTYSLST